MIRTGLFASLFLTGFVAAQTSSTSIYVPDSNVSTGGTNVIPFGQSKTSTTWKNQKYQSLIPASFAKKVPVRINDIAFAGSRTLLHNYDTIVIKMDVVKTTALNRTFAKNLSSKAVTVLNAKDYTWHITAGKWNRIGLQKPFLWIPTLGNLVIEIEIHGGGGVGGSAGGFKTGNLERLYSFGWTTNPAANGQSSTSNAALKVELVTTAADARPFGQGCKGSNGIPSLSFTGSPQIGKSITVNLKNAVASSVALHIIGLNSSAPIFPINLTPLGASGCNLFISPDFAFSTPTKTGSATVQLAVPNSSSLVGSRFWNQFFVLDKSANKFGFVASNHGRVLIGK